MKLKYSLAALAAAAVLVGCEQTRQARQLTPEQQQAAMTYRAERRAEFVADMQAKLADMDQKITALGDSIASLQDNAFADETFNALRERRSELDPLLEDLTSANEATWDHARKVLGSAWADLKLAYEVVKATYEN